jgi:hypothetical protein
MVMRSVGNSGVPAVYVESAFIPDTHLRVQDELRAAARKEGRSARRIKADPTLARFLFRDTAVTPGTVYTYKIVPVNQGGVIGLVAQTLTVAFKGAESEIRLQSLSELDDALFDQPIGETEELQP